MMIFFEFYLNEWLIIYNFIVTITLSLCLYFYKYFIIEYDCIVVNLNNTYFEFLFLKIVIFQNLYIIFDIFVFLYFIYIFL